MTIKTDKTYTC